MATRSKLLATDGLGETLRLGLRERLRERDLLRTGERDLLCDGVRERDRERDGERDFDLERSDIVLKVHESLLMLLSNVENSSGKLVSSLRLNPRNCG